MFSQIPTTTNSQDDRLNRLEKMLSLLEKKIETQAAQLEAQQKKIEEQKKQIEELSQFDEKVIFGKAILHSAIEGDIDRLKRALEKGGDKEAKDASGHTALYLSLLNNHTLFADYLIEKEARLSIFTEQNENILHVMCQKGNLDTVKYILRKLPKDDPDAKLLVDACDLATTKDIQQAIADTILVQAAKQDNVKLAEIALKKDADIDAQDSYAETALHKASYLGNIEIVEFLLKNGCSITKKDRDNKTAEQVAKTQEIKKLISDHRVATVIQSHVRVFLQREELHKLQKQKILQNSADLVSELTSSKKFEEAGRLITLLQSDHWEEAKEMLMRHNQQNGQTKLSKSANSFISTIGQNAVNSSSSSNKNQTDDTKNYLYMSI